MQIYRIKSRYDNKLNAKDLALGKINAGPQMFGMYVYGLTLGMNIIELAKIMNSPQGKAIAKVLQGNVFTTKRGASSVNAAIKFLEGNIGNVLQEFDIKIDEHSTSIEEGGKARTNINTAVFNLQGGTKRARTASQIFWNILLPMYASNNPGLKQKDLPRNISELVSTLANQGLLKDYIQKLQKNKDFLSIVSNLQDSKRYPKGIDFTESMYQLIEYLNEYADLINQWNSDNYRKHDLKVLSGGADEMKRLGTLLGSNKGVKSKIEEGQNFINTLEECIKARKEQLGQTYNPQEDRVDYVLFCTNPEYREQCIEKYEKVKHSVNILQVLSVTPHMFSYVKTCMIPYVGFMDASAKYRSIQSMIRNGAYDRVGVVTSQEKSSAIKGLARAVDNAMLMQWLSDTKKQFILPEGQEYFQEGTSELKVARENMPIALWTPEGLATFKHYMENYIVKHLARKAIYKNNVFIQDLATISYNQTATHAEVQALALPGDMMAKEGSNWDAKLEEYKAAFEAVGHEAFPQAHKIKDGSTIGNIKDAFYIYSEYVFGGRKGQRSLMSLFDDGTSELQREFRAAKAIMDSSRDFILTTEQQMRAMAQNGNIYSAKYPVYYGTDSEAIGTQFFINEEKTLNSEEKQDRFDSDDPVSTHKPFNLRNQSGKGEIQGQHFLYPIPGAPEQAVSTAGLNITYNGSKFTSWEVTPEFTKYYQQFENSEQALEEQMRRDADAIDAAINAINANMGVINTSDYDNGKITVGVKNLDILRAAIEMSLKHSRGEC